MSRTLAVMRREVQAYFLSPIAYAFMTGFLLISGVGFFYGVQRYTLLDAAFADQMGVNLRTFLVAGRLGIVNWIHIAMLLSLPGLAMRLFSEERKTGTIELLFTSPVTTAELVAGKYLGTLVVYGSILLLTFPCVGILLWKGRPEMAALGAAYLGLFLYGAFLLAIGIFASSLTENQFVALVVSYALILPFLGVEMLVGFTGPIFDRVFAALSVGVGLRSFAVGLVDTHYVVLLVVLSFVFLFLCSRVLEGARWR